MKSDASLRRGLQRRLQRSFPELTSRIRVDVRDGVATLAGHVERYASRDAIETHVRSAPEVGAVVNELDVFVSAFSRRPDADIESSAARILARTTCLPAGSVEVVVRDGWLTLRGRVTHAYQREVAEARVGCVAGIRGTSNRVELTS